MLDREFLESLSARISQLLPRAGELGVDARRHIRELLQKSFNELNLLTQEEFASRVRALERAEARITELEQRVRELEEQARVAQEDRPADSH